MSDEAQCEGARVSPPAAAAAAAAAKCIKNIDVFHGGLARQNTTGRLWTLSYGRGAPRPVVPGVLRTADGVVYVRPKAMRGPRKAAGLLKLLIRSPPLPAASHPDGG